MGVYRGEFTIAGVNAADGVLFNLKTAASDRAFLRAAFFGIETAQTNAPLFGFKRMNAVGTGTITLATPFLSDIADGANSAGLEVAWATTRPTVVGGAAARGATPLALGNGFLFDFTARPIIVPVSAGLCGVQRNASGATLGVIGGWVEWEE